VPARAFEPAAVPSNLKFNRDIVVLKKIPGGDRPARD
jgi:hypothetical protein